MSVEIFGVCIFFVLCAVKFRNGTSVFPYRTFGFVYICLPEMRLVCRRVSLVKCRIDAEVTLNLIKEHVEMKGIREFSRRKNSSITFVLERI